MAISEDTGNQPAAVTTTGLWSGTGIVTGSFSPQASTLVVAQLSGNGDFFSSTAVTGAITSTGTQPSGGWVLGKRQNAGLSSSYNFTAELWYGWFPTAPGSITVKAVGSGGTAANINGAQLVVRSLLGAQSSQAGATGGVSNTAAAALQASLAAGTGSMMYGAALDYTNSTAPTLLANTVETAGFSDATNGDYCAGVKSSSTTAGTATYGYSSSVTGALALVEIQAAAVAGAATVQAAQSFPQFAPPYLDPHAIPFQLLGDDYAPFLALTDIGAGDDSNFTVTAAVPLSDTGAASDSLTVAIDYGLFAGFNNFPPFAAPFIEPNYTPLQLQGDRSAIPQIGLADTGAGDDSSLTVSAAVPLSDTGAGADTLSVAVTVALTDSGAGDDSSFSVAGSTDQNQAWPLFAPMFLEPSAAALQLQGDASGSTQANISLSDSGAGADSITLTATVPLTEVGTGDDSSLTLTAAVPLSDTGSGADALTVTVTLNLNDTAVGADSISVAVAGQPDPYQATPEVAPFFPPWLFTTPGAPPFQLLGDASGVVSTVLTDVGTGVDTLAITATVATSDSGAGADSLTVAPAVPLSDTGTAADSITITISVTLTDSGAAVDTVAVSVAGVVPPITVTGTSSPTATVTGGSNAAVTVTGSTAPAVTAR